MKPLNSLFKKNTLINCNGNLVDLKAPKIMGILNITPDSFSDGGKFNSEKNALLHAEKLILEGAEIIDIGPQSTRPNAHFLNSNQEISRLGNIISIIKREFPNVLISLDSFYAATIEFGYHEGIDIVNDISGGQYDEKMFETVARLGLPYILMYINPTYETMHDKVSYSEITLAVNYYFSEKIQQLYKSGVKDIILDPGFGFGKTVEDQEKLLDEIEFIGLGQYPILVGISRKSFIYKPLGKSPLEIDAETQLRHKKALLQGANILRVHDVASAKESIHAILEIN